jgi:hypothetical protein
VPPPVLDADEEGLRVVADGREAGGDAADRVEVDAVPAEVHQPRDVLRGVFTCWFAADLQLTYTIQSK